MITKEINGKVYEVYTMQDWEDDKTLKVKEGQVIEPAIYWHLLNCLPPKQNGDFFQVGEPYSHDWTTGKALYQTYEHLEDNYYLYIGLKH
jgi:hypothetical protein